MIDWIKVVRVVSILGFILFYVVFVVIILKLFFFKDMKLVLFVVIGSVFNGGKSYMYVDEFILVLF